MATAFFFAHAGEVDEIVTQATSYSILSRWYIALMLFIVGLALVATVTYLVSHKSKSTTYMVVLAALFAAGVATYTTSPIISVVSLSLGFAMALLQVLIGLTAEQPKEIPDGKD